MDCSTPDFPVHHWLPELAQLMSIESVMPSNHLTLCRLLLLLPSGFTRIKFFSNESVLHIRWPKYGSFRSSISPSSEYWGLISFRINWLDLLAIQGTLKSLLQHHSSKASIQCSAFFLVQLSYLYMLLFLQNQKRVANFPVCSALCLLLGYSGPFQASYMKNWKAGLCYLILFLKF